MAVDADVWSWSSTASSNSPGGSDSIGTGADDILRSIQAAVRAAFEFLTSVSGTNTITAAMSGLAAYQNGLKVSFIPANSNTGATTININSLGAKSIFLNGAALVGYEFRKNCPVELRYDGTRFNIVAGAHGGDGTPIGTAKPLTHSTVPNGYILAYGQELSRTTYADYFALVSTTYGTGDGSTTFNAPDYRGRSIFGKDDMGGTAASRITSAGSGVDGATLGATGGSEFLQAHTHTYTKPSSVDSRRDAGGSDFDSTASSTTGSTGSGNSENMPPAIVQNWVIKI